MQGRRPLARVSPRASSISQRKDLWLALCTRCSIVRWARWRRLRSSERYGVLLFFDNSITVYRGWVCRWCIEELLRLSRLSTKGACSV